MDAFAGAELLDPAPIDQKPDRGLPRVVADLARLAQPIYTERASRL